jgi:hypothetical protein
LQATASWCFSTIRSRAPIHLCGRAVRMAVDLRSGVADLARRWRKLGHELGFGIGIAHDYATLAGSASKAGSTTQRLVPSSI